MRKIVMLSQTRFVLALAAVATFASSAIAQSPSDFGKIADWEKIVAAAKAEGAVTLYTGLVGNQTSKQIADGFRAKYGIRVDVLEVRATELRERIRTEKVSSRVLADVLNTSGLQTREVSAGDGTVDKYGPLPSLAAITPAIQAGWEDREIHVPIFNLRYGLLVNNAPGVVAPKTYADLLDPKWKGKILADDFRGAGGGQSFFSVTYEKFGSDFHAKLAKQGVVFTRDQRAAERRVATGEFAIYLPFLLNYLPALKGLPVAGVVLDEGVTFTPYSASMIKGAPHPNAARLLIDYMLSKEGQSYYAAEGLGSVIAGVDDKLPEALRALSPRLLGTRAIDPEDKMAKLATEMYK
jgi:iron(III) transport system substrate-binding protein